MSWCPGRSPLIKYALDPARHQETSIFEWFERQEAPYLLIINYIPKLYRNLWKDIFRWGLEVSHRLHTEPLYTSGAHRAPAYATSWIPFNRLTDAENTISGEWLFIIGYNVRIQVHGSMNPWILLMIFQSLTELVVLSWKECSTTSDSLRLRTVS